MASKETAPKEEEGLTQEQIAKHIPWRMLVDRVFVTLDTDCNGFIEKKEIMYSDCKATLLPHWESMHRAEHRKTGHVDRVEWTKFFEGIWEKAYMKDNTKMGKFCAGVVWNGGIDVTDLWNQEGCVSKQQIAERFEWKTLTSHIFQTLDTDFNGYLSKEEIKFSDCATALMPHWDEMDQETKKDGHVDYEEWNKWFDEIFKKKRKVDNEMRMFVAGVVFDGGIDVSEIWDEEGQITQDELALLPWKELADKIFVSLDVDASGFLSKDEIKMSDCKDALLPHFGEMDQYTRSARFPNSMLNHRRDGHVDRQEWNTWMDGIWKKTYKKDNKKMSAFVAKIIYDGGIDMSGDLTEDEKRILTIHEAKLQTSVPVHTNQAAGSDEGCQCVMQ